MSVRIRYSRCLRDKAVRAKERLAEALGEMLGAYSIKLEEVEGCGVWEIWFPWGVAKDPDTVIEYYRIYRGAR